MTRVPPRVIARELIRRGIWRRVESWDSCGASHKRMLELEKVLRAITGDGAGGNRLGPTGTPKAPPVAPEPGPIGKQE